MPAGVATVVFAIGILALFRLDRDPESRTSPALWIPVVWVGLAGSRTVSEWLTQSDAVGKDPALYLDGSPLDRFILSALLAAAVVVLFTRGPRVATLLRGNGPILLFFAYCGISVLWSDFPDVAFKRWTKALGDLAMIMVVVTDPCPAAAVKRLIARTALVLIPLSVLFIKYYPDLGRGYSAWTWSIYYVGVSTGKNGLGYVCLIFGLGAVWRFLDALQAESADRRRGPMVAYGIVIAMTLWLFWKADSVTSLVCFVVGATLLAFAYGFGSARTPTRVYVWATAAVFLLAFALVFDVGTAFMAASGRDMTLTGRTELWSRLLTMAVDPLFGTGFESFWLGERIEAIWRDYWWHPNQSHNGYLEVFLNLGSIGVALLAGVIVWGGWKIAESLRRDPAGAGIRLAYLLAAAVYNLTEAAFKGFHLVWIAFLLAVTVIPFPQARPTR
jgi:exopolysaccharide production protein ExoQ